MSLIHTKEDWFPGGLRNIGYSMLPNLIIAGAQKCGTTTLHRHLEQHPEVFFPKVPQELHYFDIEKNFKKGLSWYENHFIGHGKEKIIAQTSPLYIYEPQVPRRIHQTLADVSLIFILRNPIDRAYSHYWHAVKHGYETLSFEKALTQEKSRLSKGFKSRRNFSYIDRGVYSAQLERFFEFFPEDKLLVLLFDDLINAPKKLLKQTVDFLDIDPAYISSIDINRKYNPSRIPKSLFIQRMGYYASHITPKFQSLINRFNLIERKYPEMNEKSNSYLKKIFYEEIKKSETLLNRNLSHWLE